MQRFRIAQRLILPTCLLCLASLTTTTRAAEAIPATTADGRVMNLGFEDGRLTDWVAAGPAFSQAQPVKGDTVAKRRSDMRSDHVGEYWVGGYESLGDDAKGTLTSVPFKVTHRWASFRI